MARKKQACKNHPDILSAKRCFQCKDYICTTCQENHEHHIFCSTTCYYKWKFQPAFTWIKQHQIYVFLFALVLISDIILYLILKPSAEDQFVQKKETAAQSIAQDSSWIKADTNLVASDYALDINLQVKNAGQPVLLWRNGKLIKTYQQKNGKIELGRHFFEHGKNQFSIWTMDANGHTQLVDSFSVTFNSFRLDYLKKQLSRLYTQEKIIAMTFDGGSSNRTTMNILDTLDSRNVTCTMFLTGNFIKHFPQEVQRIKDNGHEVANHSFSHPHLTNLEVDGSQNSKNYVNRKYIKSQLNRADSLYFLLTGAHMHPYWRAPYGEVNKDILRWAAEAGYKHINWSMRGDSWDWVADTTSNLYRSSHELLQYYLKLEEEKGLQGRILLMHLGSEREQDYPYYVLGKLIDELRSKGYRFIRISEMLAAQKTI